VIELSENIKLHFDVKSSQDQHGTSGPAESTPVDDTGQAAEAESQMRRALGLLGDNPRPRPDAERMDQPGRGSDRFSGGLHRRRFVQDGDVPVTVLRREPGYEAPGNRAVAPVTAPSNSRLQRTEGALASETAARDRAERTLAEVQAAARDLQTKIGHAELAKNEAIEALRRERETIAGTRAEIDALEARVRQAEDRAEATELAANEHQEALADERQARKVVEKALRAAEAARDAAQQLVRTLSEDESASARTDPPARHRASDEPDVVAATAKRSRPATGVETEPEPEPVKWWLNPKPATKRR